MNNIYMAKVVDISKDSILRGLIKVGDEILSFSGNDFIDLIDYTYAEDQDSGEILVKRKNKEFIVEYEKDVDETLGLEFDNSVEIVPRECCNNCIFCFVQQLPDGMRDTLYVKDDDYRLSFISGSFITCTNLRQKDIDRIIKYKLSPLYISVHATDQDVRLKLLGIKKSINQLELLKKFVDNGIKIHTQIVMVPDINDGEILIKSLNDLYEIGASTCAVVPVGLTEHREGKYKIRQVNEQDAIKAIEIVEKFYNEHPGFCYCADEMYQIAKKETPSFEYYGAFEQIENGVGLIAKFYSEVNEALNFGPDTLKNTSIGLVTGVSGYPIMEKTKEMILTKYPNLNINVYEIFNDYFGRSVTVTGLVTATDIIKQISDKVKKDDFIIIPSVMLKEFEPIFLDGLTVEDLSIKLNKRILIDDCSGDSLVNTIIEGIEND